MVKDIKLESSDESFEVRKRKHRRRLNANRKIIITYFILGCLRKIEQLRQERTEQAIRELEHYADQGNVSVFGPEVQRTVQALRTLGHNIHYIYID